MSTAEALEPVAKRARAGEEILRVEGLVKHFPIRARRLQAPGRARSMRSPASTCRRHGRRDARARRRVGVREDHDSPARSSSWSSRPTGRSSSTARTSPAVSRRQMRDVRRELQIVFQDPYASLNPRMTVRRHRAPSRCKIHRLYRGGQRGTRVDELLRTVGLSPEHGNRLPARVLGRPATARSASRARSRSIHSCSSSTSRCRLSTCRFRRRSSTSSRRSSDEFGLTYLFVAHDLSLVRHVSDRVAVMYLGKVVEVGHSQAGVRQPHAPVHAGAALGRPHRDAGAPRQARADHSQRRRPQPGQPALRLPIPDAVLESAADLRRRGTSAHRPRTRTPERVSLRGGRQAARAGRGRLWRRRES